MRKAILSLILVLCLTAMASAAINLKVGVAAGGIPRVGAELVRPDAFRNADLVIDAGYMYWSTYSGYSVGAGLIFPLKDDISGGVILNYSGFSSGLNLSNALGSSNVSAAGAIGGGVILTKPMKLFGREFTAKVGYDNRLAVVAEASFLFRE